MFILRRAISLSRNAVHKDMPLPRKYQLYSKSFSTDKSQTPKMVDPKREVTYDDMLKMIEEPKKIIIDVRNPDEVQSTGMIPSSINIPLGTVQNTLQMSDNEFRNLYNREKPSTNDDIIFYCQSGRRALQATEQAVKMGYNNCKTYSGSWTEWSSKRK